jgi:hypothetical protein
MAIVTLGLNSNQVVTFDAHVITVTAPTIENVTWSAVAGVTITGFSVSPPLATDFLPQSHDDRIWTVADTNELPHGETPRTFHYLVIVDSAFGPITSPDPEIVNSPPVGGG